VVAGSYRQRSFRVLVLVADASAKAIYFSSLTLLTAAASGGVAARRQSFAAPAKSIYFDPPLATTAQSKAE
jgi:hypothetical protein